MRFANFRVNQPCFGLDCSEKYCSWIWGVNLQKHVFHDLFQCLTLRFEGEVFTTLPNLRGVGVQEQNLSFFGGGVGALMRCTRLVNRLPKKGPIMVRKWENEPKS